MSAPPTPTSARHWHLVLLPYADDSETKQINRRTQRERDAVEMLQIVRTWQARPLPPERAARNRPWRIAVLARSRNQVDAVVEEFRHGGVATRAVDIDPLAERQEVLDLITLTRALTHPADRTAWLALLRAPWCGLTLTDLHLLAGGDDELWRQRTLLDAIDERAGLLSPDGQQRLQPVRTIMQQAVAQTGRMPLSAQVEHTWRALNGAAAASPEARANAERFFTLLDQLAPGSALDFDLQTLETRVQNLRAAPALTPGAVEIATIHSAKGLEWDVVLVPALDQAAPGVRGSLLDWLELDPDGDPLSGEALSLFAPIQGKGKQSEQLNTWMRSLFNAREAAERKRLFYVVATRAREELHLFASPAVTAKGEPCIPSNSLLKSAWPAAQPATGQRPPAAAPPLPQPMPQRVHQPTPEPLALAASASEAQPEAQPNAESDAQPAAAALLERHAQPVAHPRAHSPQPPSGSRRPEGSFTTRILGNTLHRLLDHLAERLATGITPRALQAELKTWPPRIRNLLLASGLGPAELTAATASILRGLENTLNDPDGQWLFSPQQQAASEYALVNAPDDGQTRSVRVDRTFVAGASPQSAGQHCRWIIDIKTATHGSGKLDPWLEQQRETYTPQLEAYAEALAEAGQRICLGLYFPLLPKLIWWERSKSTTR